jgi:septum site-determining protein MinD
LKLIAVTSGKGGTGKSCVAAYTGVALSEAGKRTLLIEQGQDGRSLDVITAAQNDAVFDVGDIIAGRCDDAKAIVPASYTDNLSLIPAAAGSYASTDPDAMTALLRRQRRQFDYVIVDGVDFRAVHPSLFDTVLLVTTPDTLSARACREEARALYDAGVKELRLVINRVPPEVVPIHGVEDFDGLVDMIGVQLIGVVPESPKLSYAANHSKMLDEESITIRVFDNLAARLRGDGRPLLIK